MEDDYPPSNKPTIFVILAFLLGLAAASCFVFITTSPCWYVSYAEASISPYENCYGLWAYCSSTGLCGKWLSGSLLGPHGVQRNSCRALMIAACLLSAPALLMNCFSMRCVLLLHLSQKKKEDMMRRAALCYGFAGLCSFTAATWYAIDVANSVWGEGVAAEFSDGIFTGWGATVLAIAATVLLYMARTALKRDRGEAFNEPDGNLHNNPCLNSNQTTSSSVEPTMCNPSKNFHKNLQNMGFPPHTQREGRVAIVPIKQNNFTSNRDKLTYM